MANTITFRGAFIRSAQLVNGENARHIKMEMSADWTAPVREAMGWDDVGAGMATCGLTGELVETTMPLTPSSAEMKKLELEMEVSIVNGFSVLPVKDRKGETTRRELRFDIKAAGITAMRDIEKYIHGLGRHKAQLKVGYQKQETLPGTTAEAAPAAN